MGVQALSSSGVAAFRRQNHASNGLRSLNLAPSLIGYIGDYRGPSQGFSTIQNITRDASGNIYIRHDWNGNSSIGLSKFSPDLTLLWSRRYTNLDTNINEAPIGFDASGNVLIGHGVIVDSRSSSGLVSINPATGALNQTSFNSVRFTSFNANPQQNICTTVGVNGSLYSVTDFNPGGIIAVQPFKYNLSGFQSAGSGVVFGSDTRVDGIMETPDGTKVFAFYNAYTNNNPVGWNPVVARYSLDLSSLVWKRVIGRANFGSSNYTYGAHVDNSAAPVVSWSQFGDGDPLGITQLDSSGNTSWTWRVTQTNMRPSTGGVVRDSAGNVYLLARLSDNSESYLVKFNNSGTILWQRRFNCGSTFQSSRILLAPNENYVTITGFINLFNQSIPVVINYPADGSITGSYSFNYLTWTIASSSVSFTSYTSQNIDFGASNYSNATATNTQTISGTTENIALETSKVFI